MRAIKLTVVLVAAALAGGPALARAAGTEMLDLDPILAAKVAKEKAKAGAAGAQKGTAQNADKTVTTGTGKGECGINIGNVDSGKGPGRVATPRDNTVVITGPVVNLGKCK